MATSASVNDTTTGTSGTSKPLAEFIVPAKRDLSVCEHAWKPAQSTSYDLGDSVIIDVHDSWREETKSYQLPRGLLRWHSAYFAAALDPDSDISKAEDGTMIVTLRIEERIKVFDTFVCWLWTGRLKDELPPDTAATDSNTYLPDQTLCDVWIFGDMRGVPALCNAAIDMLHESVAAQWSSVHQIVRFTYDSTAPEATLRKFLVDASTLIFRATGFLKVSKDEYVTTEFLLEAIPNIAAGSLERSKLGRSAWIKIDRCQWHVHSGPGGKLRMESRQ